MNAQEQESIDSCKTHHQREDFVDHIKQNLPEHGVIDALAELFKSLGDPTRVRILWALSLHEMCVCELASSLEMNQSAVSHQLRLLKNARLVRARREGRSIYYSLADAHVSLLFSQGLEHDQERRED